MINICKDINCLLIYILILLTNLSSSNKKITGYRDIIVFTTFS